MLPMQRSVELQDAILSSYYSNHNHAFNKYICGLKEYFHDTYVPVENVIYVQGGCNMSAE